MCVDLLTENYLTKVFPAFGLRAGDYLVAITDPGVDEQCRVALEKSLGELGKTVGIPTELLMSDTPTGTAQSFGDEIEERMRHATALLYHTSKSRTHCRQTKLYLPQSGKREDGNKPARLVSITNGYAETLLEGAVNENLVEMRARIDRINDLTKYAFRYHVTTEEGTDLWVEPWIDRMVVDNGEIYNPGLMGNFPFGEGRSTAVRFAGTYGTVVCQHVMGAGINTLRESVRVQVEYGKAVRITGGVQADEWIEQMDRADALMPGFHLPQPSRWFAEFAFGANAKAWRVVNGILYPAPTSLEFEKAYNERQTTIHVAFGANHAFNVPPTDPHFNNVGAHTDLVLWGDVTVRMWDGSDWSYLIRDGVPTY